ncbi:MAG: DUF192 domain-containing protein [Acidobacteria bacterium]|nr:DUF192 domain-containing protein [Acidobacteriota bacterium]
MLARSFLLLFVAGFLGCSSSPRKTVTVEEFNLREVKLPNGMVLKVETMSRMADVMRGMMFRDSLAPDRGMLFVHGEPGLYPYWMYQVRIPLDIVWIDRYKIVTEISPRTPPCPSESSSACPKFGGSRTSLYVLEMAAGEAEKNKLQVGDRIDF